MTTTVTTKLDEMWRALEAHQPAPEYADEWATMCKERTSDAAWAAHYAAPIGSAAWAAVEAAWAAEAAAAEAADDYAQKAIDALREVKP